MPSSFKGAELSSENDWIKDFTIQEYREIDSTNTELVRRGNSMAPLLDDNGFPTENGRKFNHLLISAQTQTSGHGRLGRAFFSPAFTGVYFSFSVVEPGGIKNPAMYTVSSAVGVCRAIKKLLGKDCMIKWVNDIFFNGKKVCGILTEGIVDSGRGLVEAAVVGIGINLVAQDFPEELKNTAGGISDNSCLDEKNITGRKIMLCCMNEIASILRSGENVIPEYRRLSLLLGKEISVYPIIGQGGGFKAKALDITDDAGLLVETDDGTRKILHSGEVTLHAICS
ncbi:biotin--[acetyl-CoA-carboxylase] ligase [Treponema sp.]|uniref:biotin--[acetyl-CoA-carboxylase] ligase n=1 Tax=Treponema sp. TaxID=166 RepID=UPI003F054E43